MNLTQKMRRPSGESELNTSSYHEPNSKANLTIDVPEKNSNEVEAETRKITSSPNNTPEKLPVIDDAEKGNSRVSSHASSTSGFLHFQII